MNRREVKRAPVLRFKGFTNDWEQRKLGYEVNFYSGLTYHPDDIRNSGVFVIRSSNIKNNRLISADNVFVNPQIVNSKPVHINDIVVVVRNGSRKLIGKHVLIQHELHDTVIGAFMTGIRSSNNFFINATLDSQLFKKEIQKNLGSTINQITVKNFQNMVFGFPSKIEKDKIGKLFRIIDNIISLQQRKLSLIKTLKRSFLSDLFFKTSTNSIVITLKQVTSIRGGYAFKSKEFTENGYPIIKIANISNNGEIKGPYSYTNNFNKKYILTKNDIVLAMSGATTGKIAKLRSSKSFLQNQRIGYFCKTNNIDYNYLYYLLISDQFKKQLKRITIAGAQPNVSSLDIENFRFSVLSSKNKQKKISDFLNKLDIKIRITNKKITIFSQLKRSLLNNMFI